MKIFFNKKDLGCVKIKDNSLYQYIEVDNIENIELTRDSTCKILITDFKEYFEETSINWLIDGLDKYYYTLKNNEFTFINCDMYDDFLNFKILINKRDDKLYLYGIKHIINLKELLLKVKKTI